MNNHKFKRILIATIKSAGASLLKDYKTMKRTEAQLKGGRDLVTPADLKSEKIIISAIKKNFPNHQILSEEAGLSAKHEDYLWIIDPLDGTTNFYIHNPLWSVSVALAYKGELILGAIYAPLLDELYFAAKGQGAYLNNKKIKVRDDKLKNINAFCHGREDKNIKRALKYFSYQKQNALDCRQLGSAAIELAYVATGRLASFLVPGAWAWDVAAGVLLVREAGGRVTDFKGRDWKIKERDLLAANKKVHGEILRTIRKLKI
ncbi:MAG: inositol monophosphatase family protein [Patescibacteria group bacterium]